MKRKIVPILCFSNADFICAVRWIRWASYLSTKPDGIMVGVPVVVFGQQQTTAKQWRQLKAAVWPRSTLDIRWEKNPDKEDYPYPMGANHGFLRSLEHVVENYPKCAALFVEPDCIPLRPSWFHEIQAEYNTHDKCFSGQQVASNEPHSTGNAIYGYQWPRRAASISRCMDRKNSGGMFADGCGYPFDLFIGAEVLADFYPSKRIYQVWRPGYWTSESLGKIPQEVCLLHQSKDASLISVICQKNYPEFLTELSEYTRRYFMLESRKSEVMHGKQVIKFKPCAVGGGGTRFSVKTPEHAVEEEVLLSLCGKLGVSEISKEDYDSLVVQSKRFVQ